MDDLLAMLNRYQRIVDADFNHYMLEFAGAIAAKEDRLMMDMGTLREDAPPS